MSFDANEHPRDEEGKFTFKNGNNHSQKRNEEIKKVLFNKTKSDNDYTAERNKLLKKLGDKISPKDILYSNNDYLKSKINSFEKEIKNKLLESKLLQKEVENNLGGKYDNNRYKLAGLFGKNTQGMVDLAHGVDMVNRDYIKDAIHLKNYSDDMVASDRDYLKRKVKEQFKDYDFDINKIKGYFFKENSKPSIDLANNKILKETIKNNKDNITKGNDISINFPEKIFSTENDFAFALGKADIRNGYVDKNGNLRIKVYDTNDFNKENKDFLNKAGYNLMQKGELKPYFSIHDVTIKKEVLKDLWGEVD